jgi:hypothetical protein
VIEMIKLTGNPLPSESNEALLQAKNELKAIKKRIRVCLAHGNEIKAAALIGQLAQEGIDWRKI